MVALAKPDGNRAIPIKLSGATFPLSFSCSRSSDIPRAWLKAGSKMVPLRGTVSASLNEQDAPVLLILESNAGIPRRLELEQNYPNPFNPVTVIRYSLPAESRVRLGIYDVLGRRVKALVDEVEEAGFRSVEWNALSDAGAAAASGTYYCKMEAWSVTPPGAGSTLIKRMMLLR
jgi:hypothetical protein